MILSISNFKKLIKADKNERNVLRYKLLNNIAHRYGWRLHSPRFAPWDNEEYQRVIQAGDYPFNDKKFMIYQLAKGVANMSGDTAECGVFKGHGSWLILNAEENEQSVHHVFDSFEGVSEPLEIDNHPDPNGFKWKKHDMAYPLEAVRQKLQPFPRVAFYKGWIPDRFNEVADHTFKFVHIDVDLYQPTLDSFKFFYDRMRTGGVILCDDYACPGTPGALKAVDEFLSDKPENIVITVPGSGFIIKQ
jgi:hypothetical protein